MKRSKITNKKPKAMTKVQKAHIKELANSFLDCDEDESELGNDAMVSDLTDYDWASPKVDTRKMSDVSFSDLVAEKIDHENLLSELERWSIDTSKLFTTDMDIETHLQFNEFIDDKVDYESFSLLSIVVQVLTMNESDVDYRNVVRILSDKNLDLLRFEMAVKYKQTGELNNASSNFFK